MKAGNFRITNKFILTLVARTLLKACTWIRELVAITIRQRQRVSMFLFLSLSHARASLITISSRYLPPFLPLSERSYHYYFFDLIDVRRCMLRSLQKGGGVVALADYYQPLP